MTDHDFRFEIEPLEEPEMGATHRVEVFGIPSGESLEVHITDNPYGMVEAAREAQAFSLEERLEMEYQREMEERF